MFLFNYNEVVKELPHRPRVGDQVARGQLVALRLLVMPERFQRQFTYNVQGRPMSRVLSEDAQRVLSGKGLGLGSSPGSQEGSLAGEKPSAQKRPCREPPPSRGASCLQ